MLEPSHIVVKYFKSLKTLKFSVKGIWLLPIYIYTHPQACRGVFLNFSFEKTEDFHAWAFLDINFFFSFPGQTNLPPTTRPLSYLSMLFLTFVPPPL